jgi:hypothetical protein
MVARALSAAGAITRFAVGWHPGHDALVWRDGNKPCIFFLGGHPTREKAGEAVRGMLAEDQDSQDSQNREKRKKRKRA